MKGQRPTVAIQEAVNALLRLNAYTHGREVREMYLGQALLVVTLAEPKIIEGEWTDVVPTTVDIIDLITDYQEAHQ